jgi:hypothetical protein
MNLIGCFDSRRLTNRARLEAGQETMSVHHLSRHFFAYRAYPSSIVFSILEPTRAKRTHSHSRFDDSECTPQVRLTVTLTFSCACEGPLAQGGAG